MYSCNRVIKLVNVDFTPIIHVCVLCIQNILISHNNTPALYRGGTLIYKVNSRSHYIYIMYLFVSLNNTITIIIL